MSWFKTTRDKATAQAKELRQRARESWVAKYGQTPKYGSSEALAGSDGSPFGIPLREATNASKSPASGYLKVPAIAWRCIQCIYLFTYTLFSKDIEKHGLDEIGLYRVSGSTATISALRSSFSNFADVDLELDPTVDVHAVAGTFKAFLRECKNLMLIHLVPESLMTNELKGRFKSIFTMSVSYDPLDGDSPPSSPVGVPDHLVTPDTINEIAELCSMLPIENYCLLTLLCGHLHKVVENKDENKMSIGNLQVVFSPTLGINAHLLYIFVMHHEQLFPPRTEETLRSLPDVTHLKIPGENSDNRSINSQNSNTTAGLNASKQPSNVSEVPLPPQKLEAEEQLGEASSSQNIV
ncbi:MAG: hypothetical protein SGCHY_001975 [Lobulomycetales sp.]